MIPKRIPIPKDIKPGDVLVLHGGLRRKWLEWMEDGKAGCEGGTPNVFRADGSYRWSGCPSWDVVAIERKKPARPVEPVKPKVDLDAKWLSVFAVTFYHLLHRSDMRRLRAIAKRLNRGVTP